MALGICRADIGHIIQLRTQGPYRGFIEISKDCCGVCAATVEGFNSLGISVRREQAMGPWFIAKNQAWGCLDIVLCARWVIPPPRKTLGY